MCPRLSYSCNFFRHCVPFVSPVALRVVFLHFLLHLPCSFKASHLFWARCTGHVSILESKITAIPPLQGLLQSSCSSVLRLSVEPPLDCFHVLCCLFFIHGFPSGLVCRTLEQLFPSIIHLDPYFHIHPTAHCFCGCEEMWRHTAKAECVKCASECQYAEKVRVRAYLCTPPFSLSLSVCQFEEWINTFEKDHTDSFHNKSP